MKKKVLYFYAIFTFGLLFSSCKKDEIEQVPDNETFGVVDKENLQMATSVAGKTVVVTNPYYFQIHSYNDAAVYILNVPVRFKSNTKVTFGKNTIIKLGSGFPSNSRHTVFHIYSLYNFTLTGGKIDATGANDGILISGSSSYVNLTGVKVINAKDTGVKVYGGDTQNKPHHLNLTAIKTYNCLTSGIYVNSANTVKIQYCSNDGGFRAIGIESPKPSVNSRTISDSERYAKNIDIYFCKSKNTTGYGIQLYYANYVTVKKCNIDGSKLNLADKACFTSDRANNVWVEQDTFTNSSLHNVFITGSYNVSMKNNFIHSETSGSYGVNIFYNIEIHEDNIIRENKNVTLQGNTIYGSKIGVIVNGCIGGNISNNKIQYAKNYNLYVMRQVRSRDGKQMHTQDISIYKNNMNSKVNIGHDIKSLVQYSAL